MNSRSSNQSSRSAMTAAGRAMSVLSGVIFGLLLLSLGVVFASYAAKVHRITVFLGAVTLWAGIASWRHNARAGLHAQSAAGPHVEHPLTRSHRGKAQIALVRSTFPSGV